LANNLFYSLHCGYKYRSTILLARLNFLVSYLIFNLKDNRENRRLLNNFAPISEVLDILIKNVKLYISQVHT